jgi:predicted DNA-binding transcriptional regulator AlpA
MPDLVTIPQIAALLSASESTVRRLVERDDFPAPYAALPKSRVWDKAKVEKWAERNPDALGRKAGRPPKA